MSAHHTPGPWKIEGDRTGPTTATSYPTCGGERWTHTNVTSGMETIAIVPAQASSLRFAGGPVAGSDLANARLIAAAPDLLAALQQIAGYSEANGMTRLRMRKIASDALALAKVRAS